MAPHLGPPGPAPGVRTRLAPGTPAAPPHASPPPRTPTPPSTRTPAAGTRRSCRSPGATWAPTPARPWLRTHDTRGAARSPSHPTPIPTGTSSTGGPCVHRLVGGEWRQQQLVAAGHCWRRLVATGSSAMSAGSGNAAAAGRGAAAASNGGQRRCRCSAAATAAHIEQRPAAAVPATGGSSSAATL